MVAGKAGANQGARCGPVVAICIKNALAQQWFERCKPVADAVILEFQRQDCLDVFRFYGQDGAFLQLLYCECVAVDMEELATPFEDFVLPKRARVPEIVSSPRKGSLLKDCLATMAACELTLEEETSDVYAGDGSQRGD